jgi:hypothetical protein
MTIHNDSLGYPVNASACLPAYGSIAWIPASRRNDDPRRTDSNILADARGCSTAYGSIAWIPVPDQCAEYICAPE